MKGRYIILIAAVLVSIGAFAGWYFSRPAPVVEKPAPEVKQDDGSVIVERAPDAKAKPKHKVPNGVKVERTASVTVQGEGLKMPGGEVKPCPPVTVDLSLVREQDGGKRVIASSPDGQIVRAIDIPIETAAPPEEPKKWAAGLSWSPTHQTAGVWLERDVSRFRVGVEINQTRQQAFGPTGAEARIRVGWTF